MSRTSSLHSITGENACTVLAMVPICASASLTLDPPGALSLQTSRVRLLNFVVSKAESRRIGCQSQQDTTINVPDRAIGKLKLVAVLTAQFGNSVQRVE